jgi:hypothetical protein
VGKIIWPILTHAHRLSRTTPHFSNNESTLRNQQKKGLQISIKLLQGTASDKKKTQKYHSYVKYISKPSGGVSATHSSIQTTVIAESEENLEPGVAEQVQGDDWIDALAEDNDSEPPLDQAYLDNISEAVIDECLKRERPKGVSPEVRVILKG